VGHETDFTIIDFVSDERAPTPSAAAEILTIDTQSRKEKIMSIYENLNYAISNFAKRVENDFMSKFKDFLGSSTSFVQNKEYELGLLENSLKNLDPLSVLKRGYAKLEQNGKMVDKTGNVDLQSNIDIFLQDGKIIAKPIEILEDKT